MERKEKLKKWHAILIIKNALKRLLKKIRNRKICELAAKKI